MPLDIQWVISYFKCRCESRFRFFDIKEKYTATCNLCSNRIKTRSFRYITPRTNDIKCFGYFRCRCRNEWTSAYTWINYYQKCLRCNSRNLPYFLRELQYKSSTSGNSNVSRIHKARNCMKCHEEGDCRSLSCNDDYYYSPWYFIYY